MAVPGKGLPLPDPVEDFESPNVVPGSLAAADLSEQVREFTEAVAAEQQQLPGTESVPETPQHIRNEQMLAEFVEAKIVRDKDRAAQLEMKFSFMLTPEHEEYLPSAVIEAWKIVKQGHCKRYDIPENDIHMQTITINLAPDDGDNVDLKIVGAAIKKPILQVIEETGSGKAKAGIRFSFIALIDRDPEPTEFACHHDGDAVWITLTDTEPKLL